MQPGDEDDSRASPAGHRDSIFDFGPGFAALQPKPSARSSASSRSTTPRNVIAPDATELPPPTATPRRPVVPRLPLLSSRMLNPNAVPASARKYTVAAQDESAPSPQMPQPQRVRERARPSLVALLHPQRSAAALARSSTRAFAAASAQQLVAFALLLAALLSESAAPAPRHNAPLGVLLFAQPVTAFPHRAAVSGLGAAVLCDVFWLLRPQERAYNGSIRADWLAFSQLALAACALLKLWLVFAAYFDLHALESDADYEDAAPRAPPMPSHRLWDQLKVLFPRKTLPRRADLSFEVLRRVLALVWLHGVAALVLLLLSGIAALKFATRPQFRAAPLGVSLPLALVLKAATTLLAFLAATHRMSYAGCLRVAGCPLGRSALKEPVMHYNKRWVTRLARAKALDAAVGLYALAVLFAAAHRGEGVATRGVTALLIAAALVLLVLELWVPLLVLTAARCGAQLHALHRRGAKGVDHPLAPTQLAWSDSDSDGDSSDNSDSSEDSSDDGEASSGSSGSEDEDRRRSTRIVDAADARTAGEAVWVRHWDAASNRAFLAHSVTGETVWEIRKAAADEDEDGDEQFRAQWLALPDAGGFVCRVARLPAAKDLAAHLGHQRFTVASDVVDAASHRRVVRFAAADAAAPFLGELALDSLSLKLHAAFRCADAAAVVDIVRRLRLKDIVGDYAPCEP